MNEESDNKPENEENAEQAESSTNESKKTPDVHDTISRLLRSKSKEDAQKSNGSAS